MVERVENSTEALEKWFIRVRKMYTLKRMLRNILVNVNFQIVTSSMEPVSKWLPTLQDSRKCRNTVEKRCWKSLLRIRKAVCWTVSYDRSSIFLALLCYKLSSDSSVSFIYLVLLNKLIMYKVSKYVNKTFIYNQNERWKIICEDNCKFYFLFNN